MRTKLSLGSLLLAGAVFATSAAPLDASSGPPRGTARSTRPSSSPSSSPSASSGSGSSGVVSRSGGSRSSGSRAVSRPPSSGSSRHGAAVTRPPSGSSGGVVRYGERHGHGGGGNGIWYPGWWDSYWHFGFGFGHPWGYYWGPYSWSHYGWWGGYRYGPSHGYGYDTGYRQLRYQEPGAVDLNVKPKRTEVYVDGDRVGTAGKFDGFPGYLWLTPGAHEIVLYRDGFVTQRRVIEIRPAWVVDLRVALADGESITPDRISRPIDSDGGADRDQAWRERD